MTSRSRRSSGAAATRADVATPGETHERLTISIYQNPEHVNGILQQAYKAPLLTAESRETLQERKEVAERSRTTEADLGGKGKLPVVAELSATAQHARVVRSDQETAQSGKQIQDFVYSQAYYLHLAKDALRARGQLKSVTSLAEALELEVGDFVEFQAAFRPNEVNALLDILTPELVSAIVLYRVRGEARRAYERVSDVAEIQRMGHAYEAKAAHEAELAKTIATAVRVDFRSERTREYYGVIGWGDDEVTAVTICDAEHFVVADEDRILDGRFTVLGKVTEAACEGLPVLARNKILSRLKPEAVDLVVEMLRAMGAAPATGGTFGTVEEIIDLGFESRISGSSIKIVPIAIYA